MATREEVLDCLAITRARMTELQRQFRKWNKTMQYHVPDLGEAWYITISEGSPAEPQPGVAEGAEIVYTMDSDTLVGVVNREISGLEAYRDGKVKLQASPMDIVKLQKLS